MHIYKAPLHRQLHAAIASLIVAICPCKLISKSATDYTTTVHKAFIPTTISMQRDVVKVGFFPAHTQSYPESTKQLTHGSICFRYGSNLHQRDARSQLFGDHGGGGSSGTGLRAPSPGYGFRPATPNSRYGTSGGWSYVG